MAALGAAAGAFEGDNAREEQRARRAGLGLQAYSLAQQDRQFVDRQALEREQMALEDQRVKENQRIADERTAIEQRNTDRSLTLDENKFKAGQESDLYQRGRNEQQDAWKAALDEQTIKEKQLEYEAHQAEFSKYKAAQDKELEQLANREKMAKNGMSSLMQLAYMSPTGVVAKEAVSLFNKENGTNMSGAYLDKNTGNFITEEIGQDGKPVQVPVDRIKQENFLRTWVGDRVADSFFKRSDDAEKNAFNLKRDAIRATDNQKTPEEQAISKINYYTKAIDDAYKAGDDEIVKFFQSKLDVEKKKLKITSADVATELTNEQKKELSGLAKEASRKYPTDKAKAEAYWRELAESKGIKL